jgi:hypothetical protein
MELKRDIDLKVQRIEALLDQPSGDSELQAEMEERMRDVYAEIVALRADDAFKNHLSQYISEEYKHRQQGERGPLCSCDQYSCPLSDGKIPAKLRTRGSGLLTDRSTRALMAEYLQDHRGGEVLHEAREAFEEREGDLYREISRIHSKLEKSAPIGREAMS